MSDFLMPSLGSDMEAGTLVEWLVKPGDRVKRGDVIAVVETQKGAIEIEIFESGLVEQILVGIGEKVPVGTPLARLAVSGATVPLQSAETEAAISPAPATLPPASPAVPPRAVPETPAPRDGEGLRASPAARRLAREHGIALAGIEGSGPEGAIVRADIERLLGASAAPAASVEKKRSSGLDLDAMRIAIGAAMARSKRQIPHYYLAHQVDLTTAEQWLARANATLAPDRRLLIGVLAIKAVALAARRHPAFNGFYRDGRFEPATAVHAGTAIAIRGGGLAAPAIHDADRLSPDELMARMRDLVQRTRSGHIRSSELADATLTVSSLGERGVEVLYGVIYPPQVAIVGIGRMVVRPWVIDGAIVPRSIVTLTLAADHRVSDGHAGALFLAEIGKLLQEPEKL